MPHGITQCYLPPDRRDIPAFTPSRSWYSIKRPRRDARLSWPSFGCVVELWLPALQLLVIGVILYRQNWLQFLFVVKATALKQQILKFYLQIMWHVTCLPRPPTLSQRRVDLHVWSHPRHSYIFQVSSKSVKGFWSHGGRNKRFPITLAIWKRRYLVAYQYHLLLTRACRVLLLLPLMLLLYAID